jgi:NADH dehydrogenase
MIAPTSKKRILILGGGFGGVYTARHLERQFAGRSDVEIVLVSQDNFLLMTPLLLEVFSGTLDVRNCSFPIRAFLRTARFVEAAVQRIDLEGRVVHLNAGSETGEVAYDQLVLSLGAMTNRTMIPGSEHAFTFKTLADALLLRNHVIERLERADVEPDSERKRRHLTFTVIGGGLVGVELFGELTAFVDGIAPLYKHVNRDEVRFILIQGGDRIMPEIDVRLADYGARVLGKRRGADLMVDGTMRCPSRPEVWALGDCAFVPAPDGKPYPNLAQHALREAKLLARNIAAVFDGQPPQPFVYSTLGLMGSLGHGKAFAQFLGIRVRGFLAWFVRRTYYLMQMPGWFRRLRIVIDWTFALLFRPDIVKINLDSEEASFWRQTHEDRSSR